MDTSASDPELLSSGTSSSLDGPEGQQSTQGVASGTLQVPPARVLLSALHGGSGKTIITLGLIRSLSRQKILVQPFKKGPDLIDTGWHTFASKRTSRNLDSFFMTPLQIVSVLEKEAQGADLSIIEGAKGLFDGLDIEGSTSSAELAKISKTPVVLIIDATRMTRTAAALVMGCQHFDPEVEIVGVILNRVRGNRHESILRQSIEHYCGIPVIGALPVDARLEIPSRHLGLVSSREHSSLNKKLDEIADIITGYVDLASLLQLAEKASPLHAHGPGQEGSHVSAQGFLPRVGSKQVSEGIDAGVDGCEQRPRIAVICDDSFCFYYTENLQALQNAGAELVFANSLVDAALPQNIHALYIGGGFPETHASRLQSNESFRSSVKAYVEADLPVFAECGGLMFLGRTLSYQGYTYDMVGALELDTVLQDERQAHGYSILEVDSNASWLKPDSTLRGHEYHFSQVVNLKPDTSLVCRNVRGRGIEDQRDGICYKGVVGLNTHVNAFASPTWARQLVDQARAYQTSGLIRG